MTHFVKSCAWETSPVLQLKPMFPSFYPQITTWGCISPPKEVLSSCLILWNHAHERILWDFSSNGCLLHFSLKSLQDAVLLIILNAILPERYIIVSDDTLLTVSWWHIAHMWRMTHVPQIVSDESLPTMILLWGMTHVDIVSNVSSPTHCGRWHIT